MEKIFNLAKLISIEIDDSMDIEENIKFIPSRISKIRKKIIPEYFKYIYGGGEYVFVEKIPYAEFETKFSHLLFDAETHIVKRKIKIDFTFEEKQRKIIYLNKKEDLEKELIKLKKQLNEEQIKILIFKK